MKIESMRDDPVLATMARLVRGAAQRAAPGIAESILDGLPALMATARDAERDAHYQQRRATLMDDLVKSGMSVDAVAGLYCTNAGDVARSLRLLMVDNRATQPWRRGSLDA